jgi:CheY-like chemotaxis protein
MLNNWKIQHKMLLMPGIAAAALLVILIVSNVFDERDTKLLSQIETEYYPALQLSRDLEEGLKEIQRRLQDAVAAADTDMLGDAGAKWIELQKKLEAEGAHADRLKALRVGIQDYYLLAYSTSQKMIEDKNLEDLTSALEAMKTKYNAIRRKLAVNTVSDNEKMRVAFATTRLNRKITSTIIAGAASMLIVLLGVLSFRFTGSITRPLGEVVKAANAIAHGNIDIKLEVQTNDEFGVLATAFNTMARNIKESLAEKEQQAWLKNGLSELSEKMGGEQNTASLAQNVISYLAGYIQAQLGAIYVLDDDNILRLAGSYAYDKGRAASGEFIFGQGLVGQAALNRKTILLEDVPEDYVKVNSGLGETTPKHLLVKPFVFENDVKGVIELATVRRFAEQQLSFLESAIDGIAVAFTSAQSRLRLHSLLDRSQQQAEALQAQEEELRHANKELEEQARSLRESEARLQAQQEELRQTNEELEEKTQALQKQQDDVRKKNTELQLARRLLEEKARDLELANRYKSEFLANMSHELRTPLNSLLILARLLSENKDGNLTLRQVEFAQTIHAAGADLLNLINEILDLSKIEAGRMELHIERTLLVEFVASIERGFRHVAEQRGLGFQAVIDNGVPVEIYTDIKRVEQVVKNLLSNAFKFTTRGGVGLRIYRPDERANLSAAGLDWRHAVAFAVHDTGKGIAQEKQKIIFDAFQQEDGTTSRKYGGTGLGLSISRELAKLLGGEIHVESQPGKGSTFTLFIPEKPATSMPDAKMERLGPVVVVAPEKRSIGAGAAEAKRTFQKRVTVVVEDDKHDLKPDDKSILIIEDDPQFAKILGELVREKGFKRIISGDGETGLELAEAYAPSAILLDVGLPGIDGWAVMDRLKDDPKTRHIPVHFISGAGKDHEAMRKGAIGYLTKPASIEKLEAAIQKIESVISRDVKKLLIVEDDERERKSLAALLDGSDIDTKAVGTGTEALQLLKAEIYDCVVLDLGLRDMSGVELLEHIRADEAISHAPVIIHTGKELTRPEENELAQHAASVIIKGARSPERLLDETSLFLHRVEANLPEEKRRILRMLHDQDAVLKDKRILLVDDDMRNVFALSSVLEERGMQTVIGKNGREGVDALKKNPGIDLVLMDIMMPEMDGYAAIREIRTERRFANLPIIAITAKAMKGDREKCIEAGASDYLSKPVDPDKLLTLLRVWLYK